MERELRIELGRLWLTAMDARRLRAGSRVELEPGEGAEAVVWAGGQRIAAGETVVMDGRLCIRVNRVMADPAESGAALAVASAGGADETDERSL